MLSELLIKKLHNKEAQIGIVGLGYVGLPLALRFAHCGYQVIGIDIDLEKVTALNARQSYLPHVPNERVSEVANYLGATNDFSRARECDALILCVPTPLNNYREPDLTFVFDTVAALIPYIRKGQLISLESTTYPGTTEEEIKPRLEETGEKIGESIFLVYSPEREDPGNQEFTTASIPKVCSGVTPQCLALGIALYEKVVNRVIPVSSTQTAEMTKLLENIHRSVNISLMNELKMVTDKMGIDIHEVIEAAATKPFGFVPYYPGPGIGGHCIPVDPFYLTWKAREYGIHTRFIELAGEINNMMPHWVLNKVIEALNERCLALKGSRILVLGVAYKKNIGDLRESPSLTILQLLQEKGAQVAYADPHVPFIPKMRHYHFDLQSITLTPEALAQYDCCIVATAHSLFDYAMIEAHAKLIVDTRGVYRHHCAHIVKA